jgi:hypothetical protein
MSRDVRYWLVLVVTLSTALFFAVVVLRQPPEPPRLSPQEIRDRVNQIGVGMSYEEVKAIIGDCKGITHWNDGSKGDADTANWPAPSEDMWYYIMLDDDNRVIGKRYRTPGHGAMPQR